MKMDETTFVLVASAIMVVLTVLLILFAYIFQLKVLKREMELSLLKEDFRQEELKATYGMLEGQEHERKRLAQNLHDDLGGILAGLKVYLDLIAKETDPRPDILQKARQTATEAIEAVRRIASGLADQRLEKEGLESALVNLCSRMTQTQEINIESNITIDHPLDLSLRKDVYYIVQELILNSIRHSEASVAKVDISSLSDNELSIMYEDNGEGFNYEEQIGLGLKSIQMRLDRNEGKMLFESESGSRSTFIIEIPRSKTDFI